MKNKFLLNLDERITTDNKICFDWMLSDAKHAGMSRDTSLFCSGRRN